MPDRIGQQIGNYQLVKLLGRGGFAEVYLGQHVHLASKQAAIKILHLIDVDAHKFQEEAETTEKLVHPHIVRLLDFDIEQGTPFLVLDFAPGGSLRTRHPRGSVVPFTSVGEYLKEIVPALQYAHDQHILHLDIKPDNMLVGCKGELLLSDFGIAVLTHTGYTSLSSAYSIGGTPYYMAPETYRGRPTKASDQYALAVVVYEWLCGSVPFNEGNFIQLGYQHSHEPVPPLRQKNPAIPSAVEAVLIKALSKEPKDRFRSVQTFATELAQAYQVLPSPPVNLSFPSNDVSTVPPLGAILPSFTNVSVLSDVPQPFTWRLSRRKVVVGLAGLAVVGESIAWLTRSQTPLPSSGGKGTRPQTPITFSEAMFGYDPAHTHFNPYETMLDPSNVSRLRQAWTYPTSGGIGMSLVVVADIVYFGSRDKSLYALNARSGYKLWIHTMGGGLVSSPALANGILYVGSDDGLLYALDAHSGSKLWAFQTEGGIESSPTVVNNILYVGSYDHSLYALDARSGSKLWSYTTGSGIDSSPAVVNDVAYIGSEDKSLYALDARSGRKLWSYSTGGGIYSSPTVVNGTVYFGSLDKSLYSLDAHSGSKLWSFQMGDSIYSSPAVANGVVYIGSDDGLLYALDAHSGSKLWTFQTEGGIGSSPTVANDVVYIGSGDHSLYALNTRSGAKLWIYTTGGKINSSPVVVNGVVYVGSDDGTLYAFHLPGT